MQHEALHPIGAEVTGLAIRDLDATQAEQLKDLLAEHGVLILRDQHADDAAFVAFLRLFGELTFTKGETPAPGFPDLNVVSNVGRKTPPRSTFHVNTSYVRHPPAYTALRAVKVPPKGGATQFTNQYRAFEGLPDEVRRTLEDRTMTTRRQRTTRCSPAPDLRSHRALPLHVVERLSLELRGIGECSDRSEENC